MTPRETEAANYVLQHPIETSRMSIEELSQASGCSTASIMRMCHKAGLKGYRDFIVLLSSDVAIQNKGIVHFNDIHPGESPQAVANNVIHNSIYVLENTLEVLDMEELNRAVELICSARRIDFYGVGASGLVAIDAYIKFLRIGKISMSANNPHTQKLTAISMEPHDVAVLISYSGETRDILELQSLIRSRGVPVISVTKVGENSLAKNADIRLYATAFEPLVRSGSMTSRISQMVIMDILYQAVCSRMYTQVQDILDLSQEVLQEFRD